MENLSLNETGILNAAFLGDAVWELYVREKLYNRGWGLDRVSKTTASYVNAKFQSKIYNEISENIEEKAYEFAKRARNGNIKTYPKSCTMKEYRESTAFEALIAYYYVNGNQEKIRDIVDKYVGNE